MANGQRQYNENFPMSDVALSGNEEVLPNIFTKDTSYDRGVPQENHYGPAGTTTALRVDLMYIGRDFRFRTSQGVLLLERYQDPNWILEVSWSS